jgi:hypothetical protein
MDSICSSPQKNLRFSLHTAGAWNANEDADNHCTDDYAANQMAYHGTLLKHECTGPSTHHCTVYMLNLHRNTTEWRS